MLQGNLTLHEIHGAGNKGCIMNDMNDPQSQDQKKKAGYTTHIAHPLFLTGDPKRFRASLEKIASAQGFKLVGKNILGRREYSLETQEAKFSIRADPPKTQGDFNYIQVLLDFDPKANVPSTAEATTRYDSISRAIMHESQDMARKSRAKSERNEHITDRVRLWGSIGTLATLVGLGIYGQQANSPTANDKPWTPTTDAYWTGESQGYRVEVSGLGKNMIISMDAKDTSTHPYSFSVHDYGMNGSIDEIFICKTSKDGYNSVRFNDDGSATWHPCRGDAKTATQFTMEDIVQARIMADKAFRDVVKLENKKSYYPSAQANAE